MNFCRRALPLIRIGKDIERTIRKHIAHFFWKCNQGFITCHSGFFIWCERCSKSRDVVYLIVEGLFLLCIYPDMVTESFDVIWFHLMYVKAGIHRLSLFRCYSFALSGFFCVVLFIDDFVFEALSGCYRSLSWMDIIDWYSCFRLHLSLSGELCLQPGE